MDILANVISDNSLYLDDHTSQYKFFSAWLQKQKSNNTVDNCFHFKTAENKETAWSFFSINLETETAKTARSLANGSVIVFHPAALFKHYWKIRLALKHILGFGSNETVCWLCLNLRKGSWCICFSPVVLAVNSDRFECRNIRGKLPHFCDITVTHLKPKADWSNSGKLKWKLLPL